MAGRVAISNGPSLMSSTTPTISQRRVHIAEVNAASQRILAGEVPLREGLVDDCYPRPGGIVCLSEISATQQLCLQGSEICRTHLPVVHLKVISQVRFADNSDCLDTIAGPRQADRLRQRPISPPEGL